MSFLIEGNPELVVIVENSMISLVNRNYACSIVRDVGTNFSVLVCERDEKGIPVYETKMHLKVTLEYTEIPDHERPTDNLNVIEQTMDALMTIAKKGEADGEVFEHTLKGFLVNGAWHLMGNLISEVNEGAQK